MPSQVRPEKVPVLCTRILLQHRESLLQQSTVVGERVGEKKQHAAGASWATFPACLGTLHVAA